MKIILTGSSGFIGAEVLRQCLAHPAITSVVALSRRDLPTAVAADPKLKTLIVKDFAAIRDDPAVMKEMEGADGCIWALGVKTADVEIQKRVTIDYTLAAASAFIQQPPPTAISPAPAPAPRIKAPLRFIFTSGVLAVADQSKYLLFGSSARHIKGEIENQLRAFSALHPDVFDAFVVRPGAVLAGTGSGLGGLLAGAAVGMGVPAVGATALAAVMVELAVKGGGEKVWENAALVVKGRELLKEGEGKVEG